MIDVQWQDPAFPCAETNGDGSHYQFHPGMTLRDYFAAKALEGDWADGGVNDFAKAAVRYYAMADAMIEARKGVSDAR